MCTDCQLIAPIFSAFCSIKDKQTRWQPQLDMDPNDRFHIASHKACESRINNGPTANHGVFVWKN